MSDNEEEKKITEDNIDKEGDQEDANNMDEAVYD